MTDDGRHESAEERHDRNWSELLQELRVTQTGIQILFAFLLVLPFQARFAMLQGRQLDLYVVIIGLITASTICVISPVIIHRILFRHRAKGILVTATNALTITGIVLLGLALSCAVGLVVDVVAGRIEGFIATGVCLLAMVGLWVVLPAMLLRASSGKRE